MKKILLTLTVALISLVNARAFDWVPVENHQLFADMMAYTSAAADSLKGTAAEPLLRKFIKRQETVFESDPYAWIGATYKLVYSLEKIYPPHISDGSEAALVRMFMFRILDFPIHNWYDGPKSTEEERRAWEVGRKLNLDQGCNRVLSALSKPAPAPGTLQILKVYNMGYVIRTSQRCFAVDICWHGSAAGAAKLAKYIDVMFVTHPHGDHYTPVMLEAVLKAGKKLVLSKDYGPEDKSGNKLVFWDDIIDNPVDICGIEMKTLKGHQHKEDPSKCPNNVYHLTFDGWTLIHDGDNSDHDKNALLEKLEAPDVVIYATWNRP
ncbi:MAG: MBL fold metallo-hydrolase [Bacteroidales bacterium]|nr:MBL fold metallo-hydrolase [Bacteroidales bacterium]